MVKKTPKDKRVGTEQVEATEAPEEQTHSDAMPESMQAAVEELRMLRKKFTRLYNEVRGRVNGLAMLDSQLKAACDILDCTLSKYSGPDTTERATVAENGEPE